MDNTTNTERDRLLGDLLRARGEDDEHAMAVALLRLSAQTPLFSAHIPDVREWIREARDLAVRTVLPPGHEVLQVLRSAEVFLAMGSARESFELAHEAADLAASMKRPGLLDRAWMVGARALVRLGRQDDAVDLFERTAEGKPEPSEEDPIAPGLAFLAVGEAHLFEGRYEGAYGPLERAVGLLPHDPEADRLRYDALLGLGMLDHRQGSFDTAALRYKAAMRLADAAASRPEQVETLLLMGSLCRGQGDPVGTHQHFTKAVALSSDLSPPENELRFPTERLRNVCGCKSAAHFIDAGIELARDCGGRGDLMGYVQLTAIVAALIDFDGRPGEATKMLTEVASGLDEGGQAEAAAVLRLHLAGYE